MWNEKRTPWVATARQRATGSVRFLVHVQCALWIAGAMACTAETTADGTKGAAALNSIETESYGWVYVTRGQPELKKFANAMIDPGQGVAPADGKAPPTGYNILFGSDGQVIRNYFRTTQTLAAYLQTQGGGRLEQVVGPVVMTAAHGTHTVHKKDRLTVKHVNHITRVVGVTRFHRSLVGDFPERETGETGKAEPTDINSVPGLTVPTFAPNVGADTSTAGTGGEDGADEIRMWLFLRAISGSSDVELMFPVHGHVRVGNDGSANNAGEWAVLDFMPQNTTNSQREKEFDALSFPAVQWLTEWPTSGMSAYVYTVQEAHSDLQASSVRDSSVWSLMYENDDKESLFDISELDSVINDDFRENLYNVVMPESSP